MIFGLPKRIAVIFYRTSTYGKLVKIFMVLGYVAALFLFFGMFIGVERDRGANSMVIPASIQASGQGGGDGVLVISKNDIHNATSGVGGAVKVANKIAGQIEDKGTVKGVRIEK